MAVWFSKFNLWWWYWGLESTLVSGDAWMGYIVVPFQDSSATACSADAPERRGPP